MSSSHEELKTSSASTLTYEDLIYLHRRNIGLRIVDTAIQAYKEQKNGGRGAAITLATFAYPGSEAEKILKDHPLIKKFKDHPDLLDSIATKYILSHLKEMEKYPQIKLELIKRIEEGIKGHITNHYKLIAATHTAGAFMLCDGGSAAQTPSDVGEGYMLGKWHKTDFEAATIKAIITQDNSNVPEGKWNIENAFLATIKQIKKLSAEYRHNKTLFFQAIKEGDINSVRILIAADSELLKDKDSLGETPLSLAIKQGHANIVGFILKKDPPSEYALDFALKDAKDHGHEHIVKLIEEFQKNLKVSVHENPSAFFSEKNPATSETNDDESKNVTKKLM